MKKIELKGLDQVVYTEQLHNGLQIFLVPYENKKNYFITYATRFGSDVLEFENDEKKYKPPLGIAHFLEHKMFEQEDGIDPFTYFSKSGTDSNASTSFDNTQYICYGNNEFANNLKYLINFVNSPYYTDENVEKEKGIIAEEIKMYEDMPDFKLEMKLREAIYNESSRRIDIAGSVEEIYKITKEDLYSCYNNFYVPNNMFILIAGNFDPEIAENIIKDELDSKKRKTLPNIITPQEKIDVNKKETKFKENIEVPKIGLGIKVNTKKINVSDFELDLYLNMLTTMMFGSSSEFRERVRREKLLNGIYTEWETTDKLKVFYIMASTTYPDKLIDEIKYELKNISLQEKTFERIKKVWIANEVKMIDNIESTVNNLYDDILKYGDIIPEKVEIIRKLKYSKLKEIINKIDFNNISIVTMEKNTK